MNKKLETRFRALEELKSKVMREIEKLSPSNFTENPAEGSWSIAQVVEHLIQVEEGSLSYLMKKNNAKASELPKAGMGSAYRSLLLKFMLSGYFKFKAPKFVSNPQKKELEQLRDEWLKTRSRFEHFLEEFPEDKMDKGIYKHPVVGRLSLEDTLIFIKQHMRHHQKQISRIRKEVEA